MSGRSTSLNPATLRQIISHLDESIRLMEGGDRHTMTEIQIKSMLVVLRRQLHEYLAEQIDGTNGDHRHSTSPIRP